MASLRFLAAKAYISTKLRHSGQGIFLFLPAGKGMGMGATADNDIKTSLLLVGPSVCSSELIRAHAPACVKFSSTGKGASFGGNPQF